MSTPSVVLTRSPPAGYPPPQQGTPRQGTPPAGYLPAGYPPIGYPPRLPLAGYPPAGYLPGRVPPGWTWQGTPLGVCPMEFWVMLQSIMGYGYPLGVCHGILGNVAKHYGIWVPPLGVDRQMDGQTRVKTLPSRCTTYAGGKYWWQIERSYFRTKQKY